MCIPSYCWLLYVKVYQDTSLTHNRVADKQRSLTVLLLIITPDKEHVWIWVLYKHLNEVGLLTLWGGILTLQIGLYEQQQ